METITYQKKAYPIKGGYYALKHTQLELKQQGEDIDLARIMAGDMVLLEPLLYYSLKMGAKLAGEELTLQRDEVEFMLDAVWVDFVKMLPDFFPTEDALGKSDAAPPEQTKEEATK